MPSESAETVTLKPPAAPAENPPAERTPVEHHVAILRARRWRVALVLGALLAVFIAWEVLTSFVAYTSDAYVRSDLVAVSAEVSGHVAAIHVHDNQAVKRGDLLVSIDKTPFQLAVDQRQAQIARRQCRGGRRAGRHRGGAGPARFRQCDARLRAGDAAPRGDAHLRPVCVARAARPGERAAPQRAGRGGRREGAGSPRRSSGSRRRRPRSPPRRPRSPTAEWELGRTDVRAPVAGTVNNFTLHLGDTARADQPLIGIVDAAAWRIIANYKQNMLRFLPIGGTAWVWLDAHPWRFYRARIASVARGISRDDAPPMLLPYVAPTTDWIRLQRRFPVTITLDDPPPDLTLYMGGDARVVIFP